ncbi:MAG: aldehyde dehydrogenase family protein, partial [Trebonia sp.]
MPTAVQTAAAELRAAQPAWAALAASDRSQLLARWSEELQRMRTELVAALAQDTGRTDLSVLELDSVTSNIARCAVWARELYAAAPVRDVDGSGVTLHRIPVPLGVVGVISPWNFPLQLALIDAVPALLAGCA